MSHPVYPRARRRGVLVDQVGDEMIVFDEERKEAHSLNRLASIVWRYCDGAHSISDIALLLGNELGVETKEPIVEYALDKLASVHLLQSDNENDQLNRREVMKRVAVVGVAAVGLRSVLTVITPTEAMAASGGSTPPDPGPD
ncbi:MAG: PqqD family protein [Gemmatimonadaceae bacterium]